ncbi:hypothetical protein CBZ99_003912 [Salmonella enterica subsp. houtenae serovar 40:z4,z24:-]|uniref:Uncharacterized protein n=1 Tax=Salmonella enterica TaxID=28901 RepID=A0A742ZNN2_SALER|nr:hypothetical protein [Salmonella enterica subsp. houtenae serovar 40:z4,z24:-]HAF1616059.1 hypothetical protein [Salmonella enterica]
MMTQGVSRHNAVLWLVRQRQVLIQESGMENNKRFSIARIRKRLLE